MNLVESVSSVKKRGAVPVVAEIKRTIPKLAAEQNRPQDTRGAAGLAHLYEEGGAAGISLVTEAKHFGGRPEEDIPAVLRNTRLPLLIKDFVLEESRIDFYADLVSKADASAPGRTVLLLIAHRLGAKLTAMLRHVHARGLLALVETRDLSDLDYLSDSGQPPALVGINNKEIDDLEKGRDAVRLTPRLVDGYRASVGGAVLISQSAHRRRADVRRSIAAGADAVLVGTAFMLAADPAACVADFVGAMDG